ncbi:hypothetical protein PMAYCL1PPCAC_03936, partial [Pristionchus mayeri]
KRSYPFRDRPNETTTPASGAYTYLPTIPPIRTLVDRDKRAISVAEYQPLSPALSSPSTSPRMKAASTLDAAAHRPPSLLTFNAPSSSSIDSYLYHNSSVASLATTSSLSSQQLSNSPSSAFVTPSLPPPVSSSAFHSTVPSSSHLSNLPSSTHVIPSLPLVVSSTSSSSTDWSSIMSNLPTSA